MVVKWVVSRAECSEKKTADERGDLWVALSAALWGNSTVASWDDLRAEVMAPSKAASWVEDWVVRTAGRLADP